MKPIIILVEPQIGENIGATARAMMNFSLDELRIVNPKVSWPNEKAVAMACNAKSVIENAKIFTSTSDAIADIELLYATSGRPRAMTKTVITPDEIELQPHKTGIMFGCERTGLTNQDIVMAEKIIFIPTNSEYNSLNLAQAVVIICYALRDKQVTPNCIHPAERKDLLYFFDHLENELIKHNFFQNMQKKPLMMQNIKSMFSRIPLTAQEVRTLHGIISCFTKKYL